MLIPHTAARRLATMLTLALGLGIGPAQAQTGTTAAPPAHPAIAASAPSASAQAASAATRLPPGDRRFAELAASDGRAEVMLGKLAQERAASAEVRQYGEHMVGDHSKANDALMALANARGLRLPDQPTAAQQRMHENLAKQQGAAFDRLYITHMLSDHRKAVALFQKQARSGQDADMKAFAAKTLPTLQDHLKMTSELHDSLKQQPAR